MRKTEAEFLKVFPTSKVTRLDVKTVSILITLFSHVECY
jgi:hypothetical protein